MLSVIVPTYNSEQFLGRLLRSIDSEPSWEVIIVDDGSTDTTSAIAEAWLTQRSKGRLIRVPHAGPGAARNAGLAAASEDFVTFADADDEIVPEALRRALGVLEADSGDVAIAQFERAPFRGRLPASRRWHVWPVRPHRVLTSRAAIWGKIYRRAFLRDSHIRFPEVRSADDVVFSWLVASERPRAYESSEVGYRYWVDPHTQLTLDPVYFLDAASTLSWLWASGRRMSPYARLLAAYACGSGIVHILRRSRKSDWPTVLRYWHRASSETPAETFTKFSTAVSDDCIAREKEDA